MPKHDAEATETYQPLETACGDLRVYTFVSAGLGGLIIVAGLYFAAKASAMCLAFLAFAYFPFATAFILSQSLISLRILRAEYTVASASRRRMIIFELRQYQEMMLAGGMTAQVVGLLGVLRLNKERRRV